MKGVLTLTLLVSFGQAETCKLVANPDNTEAKLVTRAAVIPARLALLEHIEGVESAHSWGSRYTIWIKRGDLFSWREMEAALLLACEWGIMVVGGGAGEFFPHVINVGSGGSSNRVGGPAPGQVK